VTNYLTVIEIIYIHNEMIKRYGGAHGIRDAGAIEAACYRPQSGYYDDIIAEAAALMESLAINHPFIDGNKRVAFASTDVFLRINGYRIQADPLQLYKQIIQLFDSGCFELKNLDLILREYTKKSKGY
jgi:death-on-curing protein